MPKHIVCTVDELPPGGRKVLEIAGRSIGVFNLGGEYFALRNRCPHQGGPLCQGRLTGFLMARVPGEYEYTRRGEILRCPWHGWEFDVRTGQSWFDPARTRVRTYPVSVEAAVGEMAVGEADAGAEPAAPGDSQDGLAPAEGLQKGPYVAETYPVSVERQYVVVEIP
ncbi:MAG TPA: Rieske (2Fe-2S) protein [Caldilineaceae bacterium]|nr:Rieske (2Fe-2S) protein [Caldilineaceae bacterium]